MTSSQQPSLGHHGPALRACNATDPEGFASELAVLEVRWRAAGYYDGSYLRLAVELAMLLACVFASVQLSQRRPMLGGACIGLAMLANFRLAHHCGHEQGLFAPKLWSEPERETLACIWITNLGSGIDAKVWQHDHREHHGFNTCA